MSVAPQSECNIERSAAKRTVVSLRQ